MLDDGNKCDVGISVTKLNRDYRTDVLRGLFQSNITVNAFKHFAPIMEKVFMFDKFYY